MSEKNSIARPICESAVETQGQMKARLERVKEDIHSLLTEKIPFILRQFKQEKPVRRFPTPHLTIQEGINMTGFKQILKG